MQIGYFRQDWRDDDRLDADHIAVLAVLSTYADRHGVCWPSQSTLAQKLRRSRPWVNRVLRDLAEFGVISKLRRRYPKRGERSCLYDLIGHGDLFACQDGDRDCPEPDTNTPIPSTESTHSGVRPEAVEAAEIPDDWMPAREDMAWLSRENPKLAADMGIVGKGTHRFVMNAKAKGLRYASWSHAWRGWMLNQRVPEPRPLTQGKARSAAEDLALRNAAKAQATLERINARRNPAPS
jgi:hypothetical protein